MSGDAAGGYWEHKGLVLLWLAFLAAPAAWALDQLTSYALVKPVCASRSPLTLTLISLVAFVLVVAGALTARACLARAADGHDDGGRHVDRSYFFAIVALGFNLLVALLIVLAAIPQFVLSPCE